MDAMKKYLGGSSHKDEDSGYKDAVKDLVAAVKSGDEDAAAEALEAAIYECMMKEEPQSQGITIALGK